MSFFQKCLTLGSYLSQAEKEALYLFLLSDKSNIYLENANSLLKRESLTTRIANGELLYSVKNNIVAFECRKNGGNDFSAVVRERNLGRSRKRNLRNLQQFFAQCEADAICNFPIPSKITQDLKSINISKFPYYDLNYYSNGKGRALGWLKKIKSKDSEILTKLRTF